jgi:hypothetical protein
MPPTPTSIELAGWVACAGAILWILNQGMNFIGRFKEQPPPSTTYQVRGDYTLRSELREIENRSEDNRLKEAAQVERNTVALFEKIESLRLEFKSDGKSLHGRINSIEKATEGNTVAMQSQNQLLQHIQARLDRLFDHHPNP